MREVRARTAFLFPIYDLTHVPNWIPETFFLAIFSALVSRHRHNGIPP